VTPRPQDSANTSVSASAKSSPQDREASLGSMSAVEDFASLGGGGTISGDRPVLGDYEVLELLGKGGMSLVARGRHRPTGLIVALKILPKELARKPTTLQRFLNEARLLASLSHPNVVELLDVGHAQDRHFLVFEYVNGGDLSRYVKKHGPMPVARVIEVAIQTAEALDHAAQAGLVHRDIKPGNLLITSEGQVKLADLGLARTILDDERLTREGTTIGTIDYMAPEQARDSHAATIRSDIYSLGCTLYYLLTGSPPYVADKISEKVLLHIRGDIPDVRKVRPDVPPEFAAILKTMMAKSPERRYDSYRQLIQALRSLSATRPTAEFPVAPKPPSRSAPPEMPSDSESEFDLGASSVGTVVELVPGSRSADNAAAFASPNQPFSFGDDPGFEDELPAVTPLASSSLAGSSSRSGSSSAPAATDLNHTQPSPRSSRASTEAASSKSSRSTRSAKRNRSIHKVRPKDLSAETDDFHPLSPAPLPSSPSYGMFGYHPGEARTRDDNELRIMVMVMGGVLLALAVGFLTISILNSRRWSPEVPPPPPSLNRLDFTPR